MRRSLRWKLTGSYLLLVLFSLSIAAAVLIPAITRFYTHAYQRDILNQAKTIARMIEDYESDESGEGKGLSIGRLDQMASGWSWRDGVYVGIKDAQGQPPPTSRWAGRAGSPVPPEITAALHGAPDRELTRAGIDPVTNEPRLFAAAPIKVKGTPQGVVSVSVPRLWVDRALTEVWKALGEALLAGVVAALLLGSWRARALSAPVLELARAARRISAGDLAARADVQSEDEIGQLAGTFNAMAEDLRQKLAAVSEERNKIEAIISSMSDAVVAVDARGTILLLNRAAEDLLGLCGNAPGRRLREILGDHPLCRAIEAAEAENRVVAEEFSPDPLRERILDLHATALKGPAGEAAGAVAVVRDATELRRAERLRRELTANVSHELRTPLTSIKGFAETLLGGAMADADASRRFLGIIDSEASRLMKLVDDLMDLSRLESRVVPMEPVPVELESLVTQALSRMRPQADRHGIVLIAEGIGPDAVLADRDRILQVLTNLLDNAIKFTPDGGTVTVAWRPGGPEAIVSVSDTGRGIPQDDLPRVFDRFYRVERSRSREGGGTGLGLAIAKHIVEAHGGRISVTSGVNAGSTFTFTIPYVASPEPVAPGRPVPVSGD